MTMILILLVIFQIKHLVADFMLQGKYMLGKFSRDWDFFLPLLAHAGVNAAFTLLICLCVSPSLWWLAIVDLVTHFLIDRMKAGQRYLGRFKLLSAMEMKDNIEVMNTEKVLGVNQHTDNIKRAIWHNTFFWWALGVDQMMHQLVYIFIVAVLSGAIPI